MSDDEPISRLGKHSTYLIEIKEHDPSYRQAFETERDALVIALDQRTLAVHHVGSTAVPGLPAKARVDILLEADTADPDATAQQVIAHLGYTLSPNVQQLGHYAWNRDGKPAYALHWQLRGSPDVTAMLRFRDILLRDPGLCAQYAALKREAALRYPWDSWRYNQHKASIIEEALRSEFL